MVNGIAASKSMLNAVGEHSNREIIFVVGSLNTIDVTSPFTTIETGEIFSNVLDQILTLLQWRMTEYAAQSFRSPQK